MSSTKSHALHFDRDYLEEICLDDGMTLTLRMVRDSDQALIERGLQEMSAESRYYRFFAAKPHLSPRELHYLTSLDGINHVAIGALNRTQTEDHSNVEGVGVARFIRIKDEPEVAEPAVAVVDAWQSRGLGGALLRRLADAAMERGITRFRGTVLAANERVLELLTNLGATIRPSPDDAGVIVADVGLSPRDLPHEESSPPAGELQRVLAHVARRELSIHWLVHLLGPSASDRGRTLKHPGGD